MPNFIHLMVIKYGIVDTIIVCYTFKFINHYRALECMCTRGLNQQVPDHQMSRNDFFSNGRIPVQ